LLKVYACGEARSRRVLWALEEVGAPYEVVELTFPPRVHHPEYLAISPAGTVPAIEDGDVRLTESLAICEYVSRTYGGDLTVAAEEPGYFGYLELLHFGEGTLAPPLAWYRRFGRLSDAAAADARDSFAIRLTKVERAVADGREYLAAGRFTLADISVGFALSLSMVHGLHAMLPAPVRAYHDRLRARPAYRRAYGLA
jgi:glutathione S-transferase